jgi:hypothetical protein
MASGWGIVQVERGWSLFIGGAAILAGGAVVIALGQVVARLDDLLEASRPLRPAERAPAPFAPSILKAQPKDEQRFRPAPPQAPPSPMPTLAETPIPRQGALVQPAPHPQQAPVAPVAASPAPPPLEPEREAKEFDAAIDAPRVVEPKEVDRYESGDVTYLMFSDGAVEVRTASGAQRFASLAELRAQAAQQY